MEGIKMQSKKIINKLIEVKEEKVFVPGVIKSFSTELRKKYCDIMPVHKRAQARVKLV